LRLLVGNFAAHLTGPPICGTFLAHQKAAISRTERRFKVFRPGALDDAQVIRTTFEQHMLLAQLRDRLSFTPAGR